MSARPPRVAVTGADAATLDLLREWLTEAGCRVLDARDPRGPEATVRCDVVVVDVPFPRAWRDGSHGARLHAAHGGVPVLALSATFHPSVEPTGEVARSLGVAAVLPKPLRRDVLIDAVRRLIPAA